MPAVSVIVPNYNHAPYLKKRLDSILNQTYDDFDVTILDDCSTDSSRILIDTYRKHPKVSGVIYNRTNSGSTFHQWNKGVELSKGEIIWIAESDDFSDPDFLSGLVPVMLGNDRIGVAYSQSFQVNTDDEIIWNFRHFTDDLSVSQFETDFIMGGREFIRQYLVHKNVIPNASGAIFRKKVFLEAGGADPKIKHCSDWFTWIKILHNTDVFYSARPRNFFRYHPNSVIARANREQQPGNNPHINSFVMRSELDRYLRQHAPDSIGIIKTNIDYISKGYGAEGIYDLKNKYWVRGWRKIFKSFQSGSSGFHFFMVGVKQSVRNILGLR
jgi:glycosyltransferase involved in cell wall biosynthesis